MSSLPMLVDASITESFVTFATHVVRDLGLPGVTLLVVISQLIVVPGTEVTMLFAGFNVDQGHLSLVGIIVAGVIGDVLGASIAYAIGYFGLHEVLARRGPLHIDDAKIERASRWFDRYGSPAVAVSRLIPVFRSAPPYAAGIVKMPFGRFVSMATLGSIVWMTGLGLLGKAVGSKWTQWKHHLDYIDYAVVVIVGLLLAWWLIRLIGSRRRGGVELTPVSAAVGSGDPADGLDAAAPGALGPEMSVDDR
jgi:membrane protein DedA with SNARE-associated domain